MNDFRENHHDRDVVVMQAHDRLSSEWFDVGIETTSISLIRIHVITIARDNLEIYERGHT